MASNGEVAVGCKSTAPSSFSVVTGGSALSGTGGSTGAFFGIEVVAKLKAFRFGQSTTRMRVMRTLSPPS